MPRKRAKRKHQDDVVRSTSHTEPQLGQRPARNESRQTSRLAGDAASHSDSAAQIEDFRTAIARGNCPDPLNEDPPQPLYQGSLLHHAGRLATLRASLLATTAPQYGMPDTDAHLRAIVAAVPRATEPNYFAFVTGGVTPAARRADELVSAMDANVAVHLPEVSIATTVEDTALRWTLEMLGFDPAAWAARICTTGATASNVLGLACGREYVVREAVWLRGLSGEGDVSVARLGIFEALRRVGARGIRVLSAAPHSSLRKAASIVGLGHDAVVDIEDRLYPVFLDPKRVATYLEDREYLHIVVVSAGEINTGLFSTDEGAFAELRRLCDLHGAWLHVDAGKCLPSVKL
jgi:glutamate/tyrosine decarboxylase-like PLP-dependent enzyme